MLSFGPCVDSVENHNNVVWFDACTIKANKARYSIFGSEGNRNQVERSHFTL